MIPLVLYRLYATTPAPEPNKSFGERWATFLTLYGIDSDAGP